MRYYCNKCNKEVPEDFDMAVMNSLFGPIKVLCGDCTEIKAFGNKPIPIES